MAQNLLSLHCINEHIITPILPTFFSDVPHIITFFTNFSLLFEQSLCVLQIFETANINVLQIFEKKQQLIKVSKLDVNKLDGGENCKHE